MTSFFRQLRWLMRRPDKEAELHAYVKKVIAEVLSKSTEPYDRARARIRAPQYSRQRSRLRRSVG